MRPAGRSAGGARAGPGGRDPWDERPAAEPSSRPGPAGDGPGRAPGRRVTAAAVLFLLVLLGVAGAGSWRDLDRALEREAELEGRIEATSERIEALERRIERLRDDPLLIERLAREELGLVREGDLVLLVPDEEPGSAEPPRWPVPREE